MGRGFAPGVKLEYKALITILKSADRQGMGGCIFPEIYCDADGSLKAGSLIPPDHYQPQAPISPDYFEGILTAEEIASIKSGDYDDWSQEPWKLLNGETVVSASISASTRHTKSPHHPPHQKPMTHKTGDFYKRENKEKIDTHFLVNSLIMVPRG